MIRFGGIYDKSLLPVFKARYLFILAFAAFTIALHAQDYPGMTILYARSGPTGTARTAGVEGAFGSVGADLGCIGINPAGLGLYRSSDFSVTPGLQIGQNEAVYDGNHTNLKSTKFYFGQAGAVWTKVFADEGDGKISFDSHPLKAFSFAINYERTNFFYRKLQFDASNTTSMMNAYADVSNGLGIAPTDPNQYLEIALAGTVNLLGYNTSGNYAYSNVNNTVSQSGGVLTTGGLDKVDLGFGGNISDKIYFGLGLSVPILNYSVNSGIVETVNGTSTNGFEQYQINSLVAESGFGFTGNVGLIYRPFQWMRIGAAYQLPSWYFLGEQYSAQAISYFDSIPQGMSASGAYPELSYKLHTPMRGTLSASFFIKDHAFFSFDYEFQNLGSSRYNFGTDYTSYSSVYNSFIKSTYGYGHTLRAGFEGAYKALRLRAGFMYSSTPFKTGKAYSGYSNSVMGASAGIGVRLKHFYADFSYTYGFTKDAFNTNDGNLNLPLLLDPVASSYTQHNLLLTLGWKISKEPSHAQHRPAQNYTPPPVDDQQQY
ncbi:MAG TPA: outer membrane protein transport protein [Chitinophagales bacterium]|nr:outer membrane protein transport protein [Chitinophagales bacterium]